MAKNIGTLGKYDERRLWKCICINLRILLIFYLRNSQKYNLSLYNKNLNGGGGGGGGDIIMK